MGPVDLAHLIGMWDIPQVRGLKKRAITLPYDACISKVCKGTLATVQSGQRAKEKNHDS